MVHPFLQKLRHGAPLTGADEELLTSLSRRERTIEARGDIVAEGDEATSLPLISEGWACRYRVLNNGKRQIISFILPGDLCEPFGVLPRFVDYAVSSLTRVTFVSVPLRSIINAVRESQRIEQAWDLLVTSVIEREHLVSLGRRSGAERLGHLLCELHLRLRLIGRADGQSYEMPVTQADLSDLLGLSTVHVNRSLQELRKQGLISLKAKRVTIHHLDELREISFFDEGNLHFTDVGATMTSALF